MKILSQNLGDGRVESRLAVLLTAVFSVSLVFNIKPLWGVIFVPALALLIWRAWRSRSAPVEFERGDLWLFVPLAAGWALILISMCLQHIWGVSDSTFAMKQFRLFAWAFAGTGIFLCLSRKTFLWALVATGTLFGVLGIAEAAANGWAGRIGIGTNPNSVGYMSIMLAFSLLYVVESAERSERFLRRAAFAALILTESSAALSGSRSAFLGICVALGVWLIFSLKNPRRLLRIGFAGTFLCITAWILPNGALCRTSGYENAAGEGDMVETVEVHSNGRMEIWREAWRVFSESNTLVGIGGKGIDRVPTLPDTGNAATHNLFLNYLLEYGWLGGAGMLLVALSGAIWALRERLFRAETFRAEHIGMLAFSLGICAESLFDYLLAVRFYWIVFAGTFPLFFLAPKDELGIKKLEIRN